MFERVGQAVDGSGVAGPRAAAAQVLEELDIPAADSAATLSALESVQELLAWLGAVQVRLLAAAQAHQATVDDDGREWFGEEVGIVLRTDGGYARTNMMHAQDLVDRLPSTLAALEAGDISTSKALLLGEAAHGLPDPDASDIEARVLARAAGQTMRQFSRALDRALNQVAPKTVERDAEAFKQDRKVQVRPPGYGLSSVWTLLPTPEALRLDAALNHHAAIAHEIEHAEADLYGDGSDRAFTTLAQLRADALVALADHYLLSPASYFADKADLAPLPGKIKLKPVIQVTVALSTLTGVDDQPGELAGYGPIPASVARRFAGDQNSTWYRIVTDPVGRPIDYGTDKYKPPTNLDRFIRAKYNYCAYPTCSRPAAETSTEIDHVRSRVELGATNADNLIPLCARHHHLKHEAGWRIQHDPNTATTTWTTPRGRSYTNVADQLPDDQTEFPFEELTTFIDEAVTEPAVS